MRVLFTIIGILVVFAVIIAISMCSGPEPPQEEDTKVTTPVLTEEPSPSPSPPAVQYGDPGELPSTGGPKL